MNGDGVITQRGLRLAWAGVLIVLGLIVGGAVWATRIEARLSNAEVQRADDSTRLDRIERNIVRLMVKAGVEPVGDGR